MTQYTDYTAYFEEIAGLYLGHAKNEKHFYRKGLNEFLQGLSTNVNYPSLLLENYDFKYSDNGGDNVMKIRTIAFLVIDHAADIEDYKRIDSIKDSTELIVDKIYNKIRRDISPQTSVDNDFIKYANLLSVQVTPVENYADGNFGFFVTIEIYSHHNTLL